MKRLLWLFLLLIPTLAHADPRVILRVPVKFRHAYSAQQGVYRDSLTFTSDGSAVSETTTVVDMRCQPTPTVTLVGDSALWARLVLYRIKDNVNGGWAATPNAVLQSMYNGGAALGSVVASSATVPRLSPVGAGFDSVYTLAYSVATAVQALGSSPPGLRFVIPSTTVRGEFGAYVEITSVCPGQQP